MSNALHITVQHAPSCTAVQLTGEPDLHTAPTLRARDLEQLTQGHAHLILDMTSVS